MLEVSSSFGAHLWKCVILPMLRDEMKVFFPGPRKLSLYSGVSVRQSQIGSPGDHITVKILIQ